MARGGLRPEVAVECGVVGFVLPIPRPGVATAGRVRGLVSEVEDSGSVGAVSLLTAFRPARRVLRSWHPLHRAILVAIGRRAPLPVARCPLPAERVRGPLARVECVPALGVVPIGLRSRC